MDALRDLWKRRRKGFLLSAIALMAVSAVLRLHTEFTRLILCAQSCRASSFLKRADLIRELEQKGCV